MIQLIVSLLAVAAAIAAGSLIVAGDTMPLAVMAGASFVGLMAFFSPKGSLVLLVLSMLLSPEIGVGAASSFRNVVVRYDDILLVTIFMAWFARTAITKDKPFITSTPVQMPVLLYTAVCVISTLVGMLRGEVVPKMGIFYVLKYVEYFLLFFMTVNVVESEEEAEKYLRYGLVVAVLVTIYAYWFYAMSGPESRATAPFEVPLGGDLRESEPASLGGYYLIVYGIVFAFLTEAGGAAFFIALALAVFMFPAFLLTLSRSSYIGMAAMVPALFFFSRKRKLFMIGFLVLGGMVVAANRSLSDKVMARINMTYSGPVATQTFQAGAIGTIKLEDSAATRVHSMKRALLVDLPQHPVIGRGVTGVGLADNQYALVIGETGALGFGLFLWMIFRLYYTARAVLGKTQSRMIRALAMGFLVALAGLLVQGLGVNTFVIVRIMEPFWFIAALLSVIYMKELKMPVRPV